MTTPWPDPPGAAGARRLRRLVGVATALGLLALGALLLVKLQLHRDADDAWTTRGVAALERALQGDPARWDEADHAFRQASASGGLLDPFPIFCVSTTARLRALASTPQPPPDAPPDDLEDVDRLLLLHRIAHAREALLPLAAQASGPERAQPQLYLRLVGELEIAAQRDPGGAP